MPKICFVSINAWSVYNFRIDIVRHFISIGYEVLVLAADDEYADLLEENGCRFIPLHFNNRTKNPWNDYQLYVDLKKLYKKYRPDIIFHYVVKPNVYGSMAAAACNIPSVAVITGLGYAFAKRNWLYFLLKQFYRHALKKPKEVWFLNNEDAKFFIEEKIVKVEKTRVLHGEGVNMDFFSPVPLDGMTSNKKFRFLMSTRLLKSKGVSLYADAARILKKKNYDVDFDLVGFYENHPDAINAADIRRWQDEGLVQYKGFARDVRAFLANADCFVFPSFYSEGVPRCLMEAASMGLPVITSLNRGCREVVEDNVTGYLCNTHDPFDLADKMEKILLLTKKERTEMGINGRQLVMEKFNVQRIIKIYEQLLISSRP